jgi:hypothetical protein
MVGNAVVAVTTEMDLELRRGILKVVAVFTATMGPETEPIIDKIGADSPIVITSPQRKNNGASGKAYVSTVLRKGI